MLIGFKGTNKDMICRTQQYEMEKTYEYWGEIDMCQAGYHFCKKLMDVDKHYSLFDNNRFFLIEYGENHSTRGGKSVTDKITFVKEIKNDLFLFMHLLEISKYQDICRENIDALLVFSVGNSLKLDIIKYLVENGADLTVGNNCILKWATKCGNLAVVEYLIEHGADIHVSGDLPLETAVNKKYTDITAYLIKKGASIQVVDFFAESEIISRYDHLNAARVLIARRDRFNC